MLGRKFTQECVILNDSWVINLRKPNRKKKMFDEEEVQFIKETTERDILAVNQKVEVITNELARLGKNLFDIKIVQTKLQSICKAIKDEEDSNACNC